MAHRAGKQRKAVAGPSSALSRRFCLVQPAAHQVPQNAPQHGQWIFMSPNQQGVSHYPVPQKTGPRPIAQQLVRPSNAKCCFICESSTHFARDCPQARQPSRGQGSNKNNKNKDKRQTIQVKQGQINFTTLAELPEGAPVMMGTFSINHKPEVILFDSGASHSFISPKFGARMGFDFRNTKRIIYDVNTRW